MIKQTMNELTFSKPIIIVTGPTASGKSSLALEIAKANNGYIINADSKQVYQEIPIGTAQPIPDEKREDHWLLEGIQHYLYGYRSVLQPIDLYQYQKDVYKILETAIGLPILVGGTGLYIDSITKNFQLENRSDSTKREGLEMKNIKQLQEEAGELLNELNESDRQNKQRLIRIIERGGKYGVGPERDHLYLLKKVNIEFLRRKITIRVEKMFNSGLQQEAEKFKDEISLGDPRMKIIGFQEFEGFFNGKITIEEVKELIALHTNQYVKKQLTWFNGKEKKVEISSHTDAQPHISNFLSSVTTF